jgi:DNA invertase Pin-like site-specific DNA recombinase
MSTDAEQVVADRSSASAEPAEAPVVSWIVKRANDGRAAARRRGVHMGRKPKLSELQRRVARERAAKGESARAIAREWGVAHTTVARVVA